MLPPRPLLTRGDGLPILIIKTGALGQRVPAFEIGDLPHADARALHVARQQIGCALLRPVPAFRSGLAQRWRSRTAGDEREDGGNARGDPNPPVLLVAGPRRAEPVRERLGGRIEPMLRDLPFGMTFGADTLPRPID